MELFSGHQRKTPGKIKPHLIPKHAFRVGAGSVSGKKTFPLYMLQQLEILSHFFLSYRAVTPQLRPPVGGSSCGRKDGFYK